jgi:glutamate-1-semialdehyde 2,1-aminomutase
MSANRFLDLSSACARLFVEAQRLIPGGFLQGELPREAAPVLRRVGALATLRALDAEAYARLERIGADLRTRLDERLRDHGVRGHVTGDGSLFRFVMTSKAPRTYRDTVEPDASERMGRLFMHLLDAGVLVNTNGLACLSTPMGDAEVDEIVQAFDRALQPLRRPS